MGFTEFKKLQQTYFQQMTNDETSLFTVDVSKDELWETYLDAFPDGTNEVFRERREYDCSGCGNFVKNFGNVVSIKDNQIQTIWDFASDMDKFSVVTQVMSELIKSRKVNNVFVSKQVSYGVDQNREQLENGDVISWKHLYVKLPTKFISRSEKSEASLMGTLRDNRNVFKRSLDEVSKDAVMTVLDLIAEKTLYKGEEWQSALSQFLSLQDTYDTLPEEQQGNYCWKTSVGLTGAVSKIRNHSIGVLLQDISEGVDLNMAVKRYEKIVAPENYKRPKAVFSNKMIEQAQQTITEMGMLDSLGRRHARLSDITVNNVIWVNRDAETHMDGVGGIFESLRQDVAVKTPKNVRGIGVEDFINNVLPTSSLVEVLMENNKVPNLVSLVAPKVQDSKTMFKWDNNFSWAYNGNITDSSMKQRVKAAGGRVDGVLRMSSSWNHEGKQNQSLMDFHVFFPTSNQTTVLQGGLEVHDNYGNINRVGWNNRTNNSTSGSQDVDYVQPALAGYVPIENITFPELSRLPEGMYIFKAHNWNFRSTGNGFMTEIEFGGEILQFDYEKNMLHKEWVTIAKIELKNGKWNVLESLPSTSSSKEVWGLKTNQFQTVSSIMYSPNYWDGQGVGHKHYMFMLAGCENEDRPNGFFNEYLREDFMEHKRVFEALGSKMRVEKSENQLSGLGFSSTKRNSIVVKVDGKLFKVIF